MPSVNRTNPETCIFCFVCFSLSDVFPDVANGDVTATKQGGIQAASLAVTLGIALLGGLIVGMCHVLLSCSDNALAALSNWRKDIKTYRLKWGLN